MASRVTVSLRQDPTPHRLRKRFHVTAGRGYPNGRADSSGRAHAAHVWLVVHQIVRRARRSEYHGSRADEGHTSRRSEQEVSPVLFPKRWSRHDDESMASYLGGGGTPRGNAGDGEHRDDFHCGWRQPSARARVRAAGDTILLDEGAEFVGNFVLPVKTGVGWITLRMAAPNSVLPPAGVRIRRLGPCPDSAHFGHLLRCEHRAGPACLCQLKRTDVVELSRPENRDLLHPDHRSRHENLG